MTTNAYVRQWASRLMEENSFDRQAATSNIPERLTQENREEIATWIRVACYGKRGGPHCLCSISGDESHPEEQAYAVSIMVVLRADTPGEAALSLRRRIMSEETMVDVVSAKNNEDRYYVKLDPPTHT